MALDHEKPAHPVAVDGFFMDITEVTNKEFQEFVNETGYVTVAERKIDWEEMQKTTSSRNSEASRFYLTAGISGLQKTGEESAESL